MSDRCTQRHSFADSSEQCVLDPAHRHRGEHHLAGQNGEWVEWRCYGVVAGDICRTSFCRSKAAFELFGDAPLRTR